VAVAAAAELGYRPTIVPIGCDQGAARGLGLPDEGDMYVAVYFGSRADAEAFAAALPALDVRTLPVTTQCLPQ
jgi:hypothetical protein